MNPITKPYLNHSISPHICMMYFLLFSIIFQSCQSSTNPIFVTTLPNMQAGLWVLITTSPTTTSGFSYQNTVVNFINIYSSTPNVGFGIDFINSVYPTSLSAQYLIDTSLVQKLTTYAMIQLNRTANSITQLSLNYIVCDTSFWLDVRQTLVDLSTTSAYTSASSLSRTVIAQLSYKTKSNSTNAQLTYNTIGVDMFRSTTHIFQFQVTLAARSTSTFNLSILVGGNNRLKWIRICSYSYETIANSVDPPYYIDLGIVNSFSGTFPDSSGLDISQYGFIYTGMVDCIIDDTNSVLDYNMGGTGLSYLFTTTSITQSRTSYFWYRKLTCPDYTFLNGNVCDACHHSCLTCVSAAQTACLSCPSTRTYISTNHTCACIINYVDVNVTLCVQLTCQSTCLTCANLDQCGTCDTTLGRYLSGINCPCKDYTIDVWDTMGVKLCYPCHYTCQTCSTFFSQTTCLTCNLVKDHRFYRASNNTCACADKYYPPTSTSSPVCASCQYSCSKCLVGTGCTQCNSLKGRVYNASTLFCSCTSLYYDDLLSQQCVSCPYRCLTCNSQGCLSCNSSLFRQLSSKQCICQNGYFDDNVNSLCQKCDYTCSTCNSLVQCSSCNSFLQRYMDISTGKQLCLCAQRYYSISGTQQCMFCYSNCVTCNGANQNNCLSCDATKYRQLSIDMKCVCMVGYYQVLSTQQLCVVCNYTCQTCDNSAACLTCSATNFRLKDASGNCKCITGYYDNGNQLCLKCDYRCLTCSSSVACLTCDSTTRNITNLSNCICLNGFWDDGVSYSCKPCLGQCSTCLDGNGCISCPTNKVLTLTKNCICKSHTYAPNCLDCNYNCQQCLTTAASCTKCSGLAMRYLNAVAMQCPCYDGYFDDGSNELCASCHYSCLTCTSYSSCVTCPANRFKNGSLCSCVDQFYENSLNKKCLQCHYSCKTCQTYSECTSCDISIFRTFPISEPSNLTLCACSNGYYDNGITQLCYKCDPKCLICSAYSVCLSCNSSLNRYFISGSNDCKCLDGYFQDSTTFLCIICHYSCKTCLDSLSCLTCLTGRYLPATGGYCLCNIGTYDNSISKSCQICSYPCLQCSSLSTSCTSCDISRNLISQTCQCKISTFQNGTACDTCLATCSQCTNKNFCTVCVTGSNRNLDGNNLCPCIYGYHDQNGTLSICQKCHYSCLTCSNIETCLTCFSGRLAVSGSTCFCPAQRFYDDGINSACRSCTYSCLTCINLPIFCTSCSLQSNRDLINNTCLCKIGYFQNNVQTCVKCHYTCKTCASSTSCTTCDNLMKRIYTTGPYCTCNGGYFDDGINTQCQTCDYSCNQCTGVATQCISCPLTRTLDSANHKCPCNQGLFDTSVPVCVSCLYTCKQCLNANECTLCPNTRTLQSSTKQCLCDNGLYNINLQSLCSSCDQLCLTCIDFNVCLTCDTPNNFRYLLNGGCECPNGYYDNWIASSNTDIVCRKCHYSCQNCVSSIQCSSCSSLGQRIYNTSSKLCSCKTGFYDDDVNMPCLACSFDCLTCLDANTCLTCTLERTLSALTSRCQCSQSYYQNGTTCQLCAPECSACANLTYCSGCNGQRILSISNQCVCSVGSFIVPNSALCSNCQYSCQSCVSSLMCSSCDSTKKRYLSGSYCKCMNGFYDDNTSQLCLSCSYSCKTCGQALKCLSCDFSSNRVFNLATSLCECLSGYYQDSNTKLCIKCHYTCVTCLTGDTCVNCNSLHNRILNVTTFKCQCPLLGLFDDNIQSMCQTCDFRCLSCQTSATTCITCLSTSNRILQVDKCNCKNGYFDNGALTCSKCSYKCLTCQGLADNCTTCQAASLRTTIPACSCQIAFYDDGVNTLCQSCDYRCESCLNPFTCTNCDSTNHRVLNPSSNMCDCMPVYYDQVGTPQCISCTYSCVTCNHPTLCLTCPTTRTYNNGICQCNIKYYEDFSSLNCHSCDYSCKTCTNSTQCSGCSILMSRTFNSSTRKCSCIQGFYDTNLQSELCLKCEQTCSTCTNSTHCLTCPSNVNKTINATISNYCSCLYGYYEDINAGIIIGQYSVCFACHYSCQKCVGQYSICTQCEAAKHRFINSQKQCLCSQQYYDDGINQLCIKCTTNCLACWGQSISQCLSCDNTTYILNNQCYSQCPDYYYAYVTLTTFIKTCKLCTPFCLKCPLSQTVCQQCQSTHRLFSFNVTNTLCIDHCPQFYYEELITKHCLQCLSPCYHCTNKYVCTDCLSGYYLDTYCYKCHPYCYSCSGPTVFDCITCVNGYYLDNGLCRKLTCGQFQYVHSLNGCVNCSSTYPNSLTCDAQIIKSCVQNYMLQTTNVSNGTVLTACQTCGDVAGYKLNTLLNGDYQCVQICGDGIVINDACDDGNILNGDGCSQYCKVQKDWVCADRKNCSLKLKPQLKIMRVIKIDKKNEIQVYIQSSVGLRLVKQNFMLIFSDSQIQYNYTLKGLNVKYTQYKLVINYLTTIQLLKLGIRVISPLSQVSRMSLNNLHKTNNNNQNNGQNNNQSNNKNGQDNNSINNRLLQSTIELSVPLQIQLSLSLQVDIITQPPATYVDPQTRNIFSTWLIYVFMAYQIICILMMLWLVYKRIKFMLIVIDLFTSLRIIYILCTFGMHNITNLLPSATKGLQPFIYPFGPLLQNTLSPFYQADYTKLIFSSCIIQVIILIICLMIKYLSQSKIGQNEGNYYMNSFIYICGVDIYLSCVNIFSETQFVSYVGSYSWGVGILIMMVLMMHNLLYVIQGKKSIYNNRIIVPTRSFVTSELDVGQKQLYNNRNNILQGSQFDSSNNNEQQQQQQDKQQGQVWQQNNTDMNKSYHNNKDNNQSSQSQNSSNNNKINNNKKNKNDKNNNKNNDNKNNNKNNDNKNNQQQCYNKQSLLYFINNNSSLQSSLITYNLYDLSPVVDYSISKDKSYQGKSIFYQQSSRNKLTLYHLPIFNNILPFILVLISSLINSSSSNSLIIRSSLLFAIIFAAFIFLLVQKPQSIKSSVRNIKLVLNYIVYLIICVILIIGTVTRSQNNDQWIDLSILSIVILSFVINIVLWVVNLKYSPQYKQYLIEIKNMKIIQRNKLSQQPRPKIYTGLDDKSFNNSPIKNIFRKYKHNHNDDTRQIINRQIINNNDTGQIINNNNEGISQLNYLNERQQNNNNKQKKGVTINNSNKQNNNNKKNDNIFDNKQQQSEQQNNNNIALQQQQNIKSINKNNNNKNNNKGNNINKDNKDITNNKNNKDITHSKDNKVNNKALDEYDAYLSGHNWNANKQTKQFHNTNHKVIIRTSSNNNNTISNSNHNNNKNNTDIRKSIHNNQQIQKIKIQSQLSSQSNQYQINNISNHQSPNDPIKQYIKLDHTQFIQQNKKISPRKISHIIKKQNTQHQPSLILHNDLSIIQSSKGKSSKRIEANFNDQFLNMSNSDNQSQNIKTTQNHYMYKNPIQSKRGKLKSKSRGKQTLQSNSLALNKSKPIQTKSLKINTQSIDDKILMFDQINNHTRVSDYQDRQTNEQNQSHQKQTKLTQYTILNKRQIKQQLPSEGSLQIPHHNQGTKTSFSQKYQQLNQRALRHQQNDGLSSGLSDELSDEDYDLQFPTGINTKQQYQSKKSQVYDQSMIEPKRTKKVKKLSAKRISLSKLSSRQKRISISPSKMSSYPRPQLQDISSIHEQANDIYSQNSQLGIQTELNVYNKILKDHQKYKNKKVDKKFIEKQLRKKKGQDDESVEYEQNE